MARIKNTEEVKARLLEEGMSTFIDQGYHGTGIKEIVDRVGIPKGSFYNYFNSKEDFGAEVMEYYSDKFKKWLDEVVKASENDPYGALNRFFNDLIKIFENKEYKEGCLLGNFAAEISDSSEINRKMMSKCINEWKRMLKTVISRAQGQKKIRIDMSADDIADFILNTLEGTILRMKIESSIKPLRQFRDISLKYLLVP